MKKKLKEACEYNDKDKEVKARVEKVAAILEGVHYKTKSDRAAAILSFSKANLSLDEIENLVIPLRPDYLSGQVYRKGVY